MNWENSLFSMPFLVGLIFVIVALIMLKFPPKKINSLYGYRTNSSMKNQERWNFAQKYSSIIMIYCGLGLLLLSVFGFLFNVNEGTGVLISMIYLLIAVGILIWKTEKEIKKRFKND